MKLDPIPLTQAPGHFLFGFHDVCAWNQKGDKVAVLRVNEIARPPVPADRAEAGFVQGSTGEFVPLLETSAFNFPQGARQLWDPLGRGLWVNRRVGDCWGAALVSESGVVLREMGTSLYAVSNDGATGWGLNFARLHRLGGYGYVGLRDHTRADGNDGLWAVDLNNGGSKLLVPLSELARGQESTEHYVTHIVPSPDQKRLAFLHRYWLPDGGLHTRLMVVNLDGNGLRCLQEGFLSHFDWSSDTAIMIWGRHGAMDRARTHPVLRVPGAMQMAILAKKVLRPLLRRGMGPGASYLRVDVADGSCIPCLQSIIRVDGHPMFCPADRKWLVVDTYPDPEGWRDLYIVQYSEQRIAARARLIEPRQQADTSRLDEARAGIDPRVLQRFSGDLFAHTRSGLHCDLHPRWRADGTAFCIDSRHQDGRRGVFIVRTQLG